VRKIFVLIFYQMPAFGAFADSEARGTVRKPRAELGNTSFQLITIDDVS
jgi:hypothetical protein